MSRFGQTQTRTPTSAADLEAMNAPAEKLPSLCAAGNAMACRIAKIPQSTPEEAAERARQRDLQSKADREAIATRLVNVGVSPIIAKAVRTGKDVVYAKTTEEGERIIWWERNKNYVLTGVCVFLAGTGVFLYFR